MAKDHFLEQHDPDRKDFQIDRIILFSDAVFAIAITLLIIEIKAPVILSGFSRVQMLEQLEDLIPKFIGFIVSFFVISVYWRSHHRIFGFVTNYTSRLIRINTLFLFSIVLMPFSSAYYSENFAYNIPFYFYTCNAMLTGILNLWLNNYVFDPSNHILTHLPDSVYLRKFKIRTIAPILVFASAIVVCLYWPTISRFWFILIWPVNLFINRYFKHKLPDIHSV